MRIVKLGTEAHESLPSGNYKIEEYQVAASKIRSELNAPIDLSVCIKVTYDSKTDRYTATFNASDKTATLKVTNAVAEFLTTNLRQYGSMQGRMENGVLVDVYLIQPD